MFMRATPKALKPAIAALGTSLLLGVPAPLTAQTVAAAQRPPLIVAPVIEGLHMCDQAALNPAIANVYDAEAQCRRMKMSGAVALNRLLDTLEPGGPKGQVQVGYTATLQLLGLYHHTNKGWEIDESQLDNFLRVIRQVKRPVVLYLAADHFDSFGPLTRELQKDAKNLLQLRDGKPLALNYFGYHVIPYTLQTDPLLSVNRYRYAALEHVARKLQTLSADVQSRIVAITFMGELHHMFPDFENGMGAFKDIQVTDYSAASVAGFRTWLQQKFSTVERLNEATELKFTSFNEVVAPSKNIRKEKLSHFGEHYDAFADGILTFAGWVWDPQNTVRQLDFFVNGKLVGPMERHLNRLDVYRAVETVTDPNVGFRFRYDYSTLPPGRYNAQAVATSGGKQYVLGETEFVVIARNQSTPSRQAAKGLPSLPSAAKKLPGLQTWMDLPGPMVDVYYNPLARLWNEYRDWQVQNLLREFYTRGLRAGLPASKLFSHQIMPRVNSSWNPQLLAADSTLKGSMPWKQGINMYGGATNSPWMRDYLASERITDYGVPEFHPQQWKSAAVHTAALQAQYDQGARFVSPYYFSIVPQRFKGNAFGINRLELGPDNAQDGSSHFYRALVEFAKK